MAIPAIPQNYWVQQGNSDVYLSWNLVSGATSYSVQRSTDGVSYSTLATPSTPYYLDESATVQTQYYYKVASVNSYGTSSYTSPQSTVPVLPGNMSLGELRLRSQQRADRVNSNFVTLPEWNYYINQSYYELYDLLITVYEDYFVAPRLSISTTNAAQYNLPNGSNYNEAPALYKLFGVDLGLDASNNAWVTIKKFDFLSRNRYVFPQITSTFLGVFNLQYRLVGNTIMFIPTPSAGQVIGLWYFPRLTQLLADTDVMDGISGWTEYVIVDAAIKALRKEESDTQELQLEKNMLIQRINDSASNRDAGQGDTITDSRSWSSRWGTYGGPGFDGPWGGS